MTIKFKNMVAIAACVVTLGGASSSAFAAASFDAEVWAHLRITNVTDIFQTPLTPVANGVDLDYDDWVSIQGDYRAGGFSSQAVVQYGSGTVSATGTQTVTSNGAPVGIDFVGSPLGDNLITRDSLTPPTGLHGAEFGHGAFDGLTLATEVHGATTSASSLVFADYFNDGIVDIMSVYDDANIIVDMEIEYGYMVTATGDDSVANISIRLLDEFNFFDDVFLPIDVTALGGETFSDTGTILITGYEFDSLDFGLGGLQLLVDASGSAAVPGPATLPVFAMGLAGLAFVRRRRLAA